MTEKSKFDLFTEKFRDWSLAICAFFIAAFYYESKQNDDEQAKTLVEISKNTAISAQVDKQFAERLDKNDIRDDRQDDQIKKLGERQTALETRFEYTGRR